MIQNEEFFTVEEMGMADFETDRDLGDENDADDDLDEFDDDWFFDPLDDDYDVEEDDYSEESGA